MEPTQSNEELIIIENKTLGKTIYAKPGAKVSPINDGKNIYIGFSTDDITINEVKYDEPISRTKLWVIGKVHRSNGPSIILNKQTLEYHQDGKRHRLDGPAIQWWDDTTQDYSGKEKWFIKGKRLSLDKIRLLKVWLGLKSNC